MSTLLKEDGGILLKEDASYSPVSQIIFNTSLSDIIKAGDSLSSMLEANPSLIDSLIAGDTASTQQVMQVLLSDGFEMYDRPDYLGRMGLKIIAITAKYREVRVLSSEYRNIKGNTAKYRNVEVITAQARLIKAYSSLYRLLKSFTTGG